MDIWFIERNYSGEELQDSPARLAPGKECWAMLARRPCAHLSDIIVATAHLQICSMSDHSVYTGKCFILAKPTNEK